ncbi:MAG TPA: hypothetical protein VMI54_20470 [Polyangiaceae bacterium]|nr:hypothetical protein [Polyangiaceae bacterium]
MRIRPLTHLAFIQISIATVFSGAGCATAPDSVRDVAASSLHCPREELEVALNRQTHTVREYAVACNFMYTRVHCTAQGCKPAEVEPPCLGNMPCFEEDPETLTWKLSENDAAKARARRTQ